MLKVYLLFWQNLPKKLNVWYKTNFQNFYLVYWLKLIFIQVSFKNLLQIQDEKKIENEKRNYNLEYEGKKLSEKKKKPNRLWNIFLIFITNNGKFIFRFIIFDIQKIEYFTLSWIFNTKKKRETFMIKHGIIV